MAVVTPHLQLLLSHGSTDSIASAYNMVHAKG